jgi:hypothetical protein
MSPLNIHPEESVSSPIKKNNKSLKVMLGIAALVLAPVIGTTLAANIDINGGNNATVEFAQGDITTAGCDQTITISATSRFFSGAYHIDKITLSNFDFSTCSGKTIIVSAAEGAGQEVGLTAADGDVAEILIGVANNVVTVSCANAAFVCPVADSVTADSFTLKVDDDPIPSVSIAKFLIQSS